MRSSPDPASGALWSFATQFYARPEVERTLLQLQDENGLDIPLLITLLYAGRHGLVLSEKELGDALALAQRWQSRTIAPLRMARRALKAPEGTRPDSDQESLRTQIKSVELAAERVLIRRLEALLPPRPTLEPRPAIAANLAAYFKTLPRSLPIPSVLVEESLSV
jgi:uncharacterized protein (TIGR02444 family)